MKKNFGYMLHLVQEVQGINICNTRNILTLKMFFENHIGGEGSYYDEISYHRAIEKFSGEQIVSIFEYTRNLIYHTPKLEDLDSLFKESLIDSNLRRVIFYNLYDMYRIKLNGIFTNHLGLKYINEIIK